MAEARPCYGDEVLSYSWKVDPVLVEQQLETYARGSAGESHDLTEGTEDGQDRYVVPPWCKLQLLSVSKSCS